MQIMSNLGMQMRYIIIRLKCPVLQISAVRFNSEVSCIFIINVFRYEPLPNCLICTDRQTGSPIVASLAG